LLNRIVLSHSRALLYHLVAMRDRFRASILISLWLVIATGCAARPAHIPAAIAEERYKLVSDHLAKLASGGRIAQVHWADDGSSVTYTRNGERFSFDLKSHVITKTAQAQPDGDRPRPRTGRSGDRPSPPPARGRQRDREPSPDGKWLAISKDWNVVIEPVKNEGDDADDRAPVQVTTTGNRKFRYGTASWVYGEELDQHNAMWWSPDSRKLAFYEFDERNVPDHYIAAGLTDLHTRILTEGYPKAGEPNPIANVLIYDLETRETIRVKSADNPENSYTYDIRFTPSGSELFLHRTNRHQNVMHLMAADVANGNTRIILTETQATWQENSPEIKFLSDCKRFIWATERSGWKQYELRDLQGNCIVPLTRGDYPCATILAVDESTGVMYYTAFSDANPLNAQLHRVGLDGAGQRRLTTEPLNHTSIRISPDYKWFIAEYESVDTPPTAALYDITGNRIALLATSDDSKFRELNLSSPELFSFKANDGKTDLYGILYRPSHFDSSKRYPLAIDVYGGPLSQSVRNRFIGANPACEYGLLIAQIDNRGTQNRGKAFESATYLRLGDVDIQDQVDGVRFLAKRPYVDASRVAIYGYSYGGYMSALALLKYPDVFHVAVAGGTVTDWRNYDTIYTERFMRTPQENPKGYDEGSCMKYVNQLKGKLLLLHGMVDDNVHSNNAWQLIDALQKAGKAFDMMFFPNAGHSLGANAAQARWRYLREHLLAPAPVRGVGRGN
jgi:dipeptidyl-peptidase-4